MNAIFNNKKVAIKFLISERVVNLLERCPLSTCMGGGKFRLVSRPDMKILQKKLGFFYKPKQKAIEILEMAKTPSDEFLEEFEWRMKRYKIFRKLHLSVDTLNSIEMGQKINYTWKLTRPIPLKRNDPDVKLERNSYCEWYQTSHAWGKKGKTTNPVLSKDIGQNITMILAINCRNIISSEAIVSTGIKSIFRRDGGLQGTNFHISCMTEACGRVMQESLANYINHCEQFFQPYLNEEDIGREYDLHFIDFDEITSRNIDMSPSQRFWEFSTVIVIRQGNPSKELLLSPHFHRENLYDFSAISYLTAFHVPSIVFVHAPYCGSRNVSE
ncbi:hypothetical protein RF11_15688 [Thelohanellus kitauei]|uniref:Uncharacterized protein n=1 Tax=Thelohanellus kitauei TaxID=669202 RepID=A0A0C2N7J0_THEKT|nr:hypothetical protein RF11_15688 [Thelohanellus kitauei]